MPVTAHANDVRGELGTAMITLVPLCTMALMLGKAVDAGNTPAGQHMAAEITSATLSGRLNGTLARAGSSDWFTVTPGGLILPDVRLAIQTADTGDPRYQWLNPVQAAGKGIMAADLSRIDYELYELR